MDDLVDLLLVVFITCLVAPVVAFLLPLRLVSVQRSKLLIDMLFVSRLRGGAFERLAVKSRCHFIRLLAADHVMGLMLLHRLVVLWVPWGSETSCTCLLRCHCCHVGGLGLLVVALALLET